MKKLTLTALAALLILPMTQTLASDLNTDPNMECKIVSKAKKIQKQTQSSSTDGGKLRMFKLARVSCFKDYAGAYPVNMKDVKEKSKTYVQFDCASCYTASNHDHPAPYTYGTVTGKAPEEAWLSTIAEAQ